MLLLKPRNLVEHLKNNNAIYLALGVFYLLCNINLFLLTIVQDRVLILIMHVYKQIHSE